MISGVPEEKPLGAKERTNNKLNPHMASTPGFKPWPHWWEASAVTTAPSLAPKNVGVEGLGATVGPISISVLFFFFIFYFIRCSPNVFTEFKHFDLVVS